LDSVSPFIFCYLYLSLTQIYTLSLHDALPIFFGKYIYISFSFVLSCAYTTIRGDGISIPCSNSFSFTSFRMILAPSHCITGNVRSEEHTSELQSRFDLVCRLLLATNSTPARQPAASEVTT